MYGEENIISRSHVNETTLICIVIFVPLTKRESIGEDVIGDKNTQDAREKFLEAMQERDCLALSCTFGARKHSLTA